MSTKKGKQLNNGNNSTAKNDSTQSSESKFSEESQNNLNSSESGQQYEIIDDSPFAAIKQEGRWKIAIGNMVASPYDFESIEDARKYVREKHWMLLWTMAIWLINNQEKFTIEKK